jgi:hypothetical protein
VLSGNATVFVTSMLGVGLLLATADARAPDSPRASALLVAAELLPESSPVALMDCAAGNAGESVELRFERITRDPDPHETRTLQSRHVGRTVGFEWDPEAGELSYNAVPALTPPAARGAASSSRFQGTCESR